MKTILLLLIMAAMISIGAAAPTISGPTSGASGTAYSYTSTAAMSWDVPPGEVKTVQLVATWSDGSTSLPLAVTITGPAIANNPPRTAYIPDGPLTGKTTLSYTYKTMATDPDGDKVKYTFDWGDGAKSTTEYVTSGTYVSATHKWPDMPSGTSKSYSLRAMATDEHGAVSAWSDVRKVLISSPYVNYKPSKPILTGPTDGVSGIPYAFTVMSTDQNEDTIRYIISWGDGTNTNTALFASGQLVTVYHTWNVPAGKTWRCYIDAMAIDRYNLAGVACSDQLVLTMKGPTAPAMKMDAIQKPMGDNASPG